MPKKPQPHRYIDRTSFERLLILIATLIQHPGVGSRQPLEHTPNRTHHNALTPLQSQIRQVAKSLGISYPDRYPSIGTLRKDLETLRNYGILDHRKYRWGYYLGTGVMNRDELKVAFNALHSQAMYQGDPQIRKIYYTLEKRLRGLELEGNTDISYPVRAYMNRPIIQTDPEVMAEKGTTRHTLFHCLDRIEDAIATGQLIELYRLREPYHNNIGYLQIYPLQLFYHDIAWYLLYETASNPNLYQPDEIQHLEVERLDRLKNYCKILHSPGRGQNAQFESLKLAQKLFKTGWGINLGTPEEQYNERKNQESFERITVRFFPPCTQFIREGECRHNNQKITSKKDQDGQEYIDYSIKLPRRSLPEFCRWVYRHIGCSQFISPPELVEKHQNAIQAAANRYSALHCNKVQ